MAYKPKEIEKIFSEICRLISEEGLSQRKALAKNSKPDKETFYKWMDEDEKKLEQYIRAREERANLIFEDILHIADDTRKDTQTVNIGEVEIEQINHDAIQRSRLRVDARKWMLGKMHPKKYGDKVDVTSGGEKIQTITGMEIVNIPDED